MTAPALVFVESNTTGTGRLFCQAARRLGFRPLLLTDRAERYPFAREDAVEVLPVATEDLAAVLEVCRGLQAGPGLAGVTSSSEYFIATAAAVACRLGLPGPDANSLRECRNKYRQRQLLARARVGIPAFREADSVSGTRSAAAALGLPVVVKPPLGSGSLGVRLCTTLEQVEAHAADLLARRHNERGQSLPRQVLVESLVEGLEYSIETFDGRVIGVTRKQLGQPPFFVEVGHDFPAPGSAQGPLAEETVRALNALGLHWGPAHTEARISSEGVKIIEVNARLAGGCIPELVRLARGIDLVSATLARATGAPPPLEPTSEAHAAIRFLLPPCEGRLIAVENLERASRLPGVVDCRLYAGVGDRLWLRGDFRDRVGHVIAAGPDARTTQERVAAAWAAVGLRVEPIQELCEVLS